jgi:4-hydroxybenzoate polyprenyltransferase
MTAAPAPVWSPSFWSGYWITLRPYLFCVSGVSGLAGLALAPEAGFHVIAFASVAFLLSYGLGQALTDVFQTDTDSLSAPYRPLVRGEISGPTVMWVSVAGLLGCGAVLALLNPWSAPISLLAVAGLATYTPVKRVFWAGPAWNGWIVACLPLIGALSATGLSPMSVVRLNGMLPVMGSVFFSYAVFVILGYFKDIDADARTGYETLPVRFGRGAALVTSGACLLGALLCSLLVVRVALGNVSDGLSPGDRIGVGGGAALWSVGFVLLALAHVRMRGVRTDWGAYPAIVLSVRGFVLLHLGEAVLLRPALLLPALLLAVASDLALRHRPMQAQV